MIPGTQEQPEMRHPAPEIGGDRHVALDQARTRLILVSAVFMLGFMAVALRLSDLTLLHVPFSEVAPVAADATATQKWRAEITDRNGALLASSLKTASLFADPKLIDDPARVAKELTETLPELNYGDTLQKLQGERRFVWLYRNLTPRQQYAVNSLGHPGLAFRTEHRRIYPQGGLTAHVTGYTDVDSTGIAGIEKSFDSLLRNGEEPLRLTLDLRVQHILHRELSASMKRFNAKHAAGLVMDAKTGEVLAMTSLPDFDPHKPDAYKPAALFNRATLGVFEMGSTFKLFTIAAALDSGKFKLGDKLDITDPIRAGRFTIRDYHPIKREATLPEIFIHSSNIGSAMIAQEIGTDGMKDFYERTGMFAPARIELPEIGAPLVPQPWREINTLTASFGHGLAVSPLQLARATAALVNGGEMVQPTLILSDDDQKGENTAKTRVISPQTSARIRQLMELAVVAGTGSKAKVEGYSVGGKTGTAEKVTKHGYDRKSLLSSFIAAFPMDDPQYIVLAILDEPKGTKDTYGYATGGWTAAPVVSAVIGEMAPLLNIMPADKDAAGDIRKAMDIYLKKDKHLASY